MYMNERQLAARERMPQHTLSYGKSIVAALLRTWLNMLQRNLNGKTITNATKHTSRKLMTNLIKHYALVRFFEVVLIEEIRRSRCLWFAWDMSYTISFQDVHTIPKCANNDWQSLQSDKWKWEEPVKLKFIWFWRRAMCITASGKEIIADVFLRRITLQIHSWKQINNSSIKC